MDANVMVVREKMHMHYNYIYAYKNKQEHFLNFKES